MNPKQKRYDSLLIATNELNTKYAKALEEISLLNVQLTAANQQIEAKQITVQLLAEEQNKQEARHSEQVKELIGRIRVLEGALNGNID